MLEDRDCVTARTTTTTTTVLLTILEPISFNPSNPLLFFIASQMCTGVAHSYVFNWTKQHTRGLELLEETRGVRGHAPPEICSRA